MVFQSLAGILIPVVLCGPLTCPGVREITRADSRFADLRQSILAAEHNRARSEKELATLTTSAVNEDPKIQCLAVRALGRLERPELVQQIRPLMSAAAPGVRLEAVTAFGRAVAADRLQASGAGVILIEQLARERDEGVRAALCEVLGRLPFQAAADVTSAEGALVAATRTGSTSDARPVILLGAARGLESLIRLRAKISPAAPETVERLRRLCSTAKEATVRRLALAALVSSGKLSGSDLASAIRDADDQVRRLAARGAASLPTGNANADEVLTRGLEDAAAMVRYDALATYSRRHRAESCGTILAALKDRSPHVALQAIDLLAGGCAPDGTATAALERIAEGLPASAADRGWHEPAHALAALAKIAPGQARPRLARFAEHRQWQVRAYAARAAATVGDTALLEKLARDDSDNVRNAAMSGLIGTRRHEEDLIYLEGLASKDYQLISTAARGLTGTLDKKGAVSALFASLSRLTLEHRDTSRDPRVSILQRLRELGSAENAAALSPYLDDFDPQVAALAAELLTGWTGKPHQPITKSLDPGPPPQFMDLEALGSATAVVTMRSGGSFEIRLLPDDAPATVLRFVHLARTGYYNGLTFHRVEPNFVIQGGSPGANEYMGDARYMRDELGLRMHARGTVGISTRGRDTGDAQIFINLVDNPRLDPDYTVFAVTIRGMDTMDGILEGDVIDRIEIRTSGSGSFAK